VSTGSPVPPDLFRWDTLRDVGPFDLPYRPPVPGRMMEVELADRPGVWIRVWRAADGLGYFCHGLTFGGTAAPGGPVSPFSGPPVEAILVASFRRVDPETAARAGDILVWHDPGPVGTPHSAILLNPVVNLGLGLLDYASTLATKNGMEAKAVATLENVADVYGDTYTVYARAPRPTGGL
jgi:hypothetical protein